MIEVILVIYAAMSYGLIGMAILYNDKKIVVVDALLWLISPIIFPIVVYFALEFYKQDVRDNS